MEDQVAKRTSGIVGNNSGVEILDIDGGIVRRVDLGQNIFEIIR